MGGVDIEMRDKNAFTANTHKLIVCSGSMKEIITKMDVAGVGGRFPQTIGVVATVSN